MKLKYIVTFLVALILTVFFAHALVELAGGVLYFKDGPVTLNPPDSLLFHAIWVLMSWCFASLVFFIWSVVEVVLKK
jgi:hypothetical protein